MRRPGKRVHRSAPGQPPEPFCVFSQIPGGRTKVAMHEPGHTLGLIHPYDVEKYPYKHVPGTARVEDGDYATMMKQGCFGRSTLTHDDRLLAVTLYPGRR